METATLPFTRTPQSSVGTADEIVGRAAQMARIVDTVPGGGEHRPLDVDAEHAGNASVDRLLDRAHGLVDHGAIVGDDGGKKPRGAIAAVRRADGDEAVDRRRLVEQRAAAAVDLDVDEAGREHAAVECANGRAARRLALGQHGGDLRSIEHHRQALDQRVAAQHPGAGENDRHQRVRLSVAAAYLGTVEMGTLQ